MAQKTDLLVSRNELVLKSIENFKVNREPALTPFKQRNGYNLLPKHSTPPSHFFKIRNPFEKDVADDLHKSFCSPTIFTQTKTTLKEKEFEWTIDEISEVHPANIEVCTSQFETKYDPNDENKVQAEIKNFFERDDIVTSPYATANNCVLPTDGIKKCLFKDSAVQTDLTIPAKLSPEVENLLRTFCTYSHEHESNCSPVTNFKDESMMKDLFKDEHILQMANDTLNIDYNSLTPIPKSPVFSSLVHSQRKFNYGTPTLYNIPSPSLISPITKTIPLPTLSPIETPSNKKPDKVFLLKQNKICSSFSYKTGKYPLCQSTPESIKNINEQKLGIVIDDKMSMSMSPLTQCYDDFENNFLERNTPNCKSRISQDMSIDMTRSDFAALDSPAVNKASSVFRNNFTIIDVDKLDNGLTPLSPMQTSQMETPLKKRSASAKNLSRSFDLPEGKENTDIKIDSGFTETTTFDSICDSTRLNKNPLQTNISKHCYSCNNISKLNILNYKRISELRCNYCQRQFEIF